MNFSQRQLNRVLTKISGLPPVKFILEQRLKYAYTLLSKNNYNTRVSDVQYKVGITNSSYFNKKFKSRFGINPSDLLKKQ